MANVDLIEGDSEFTVIPTVLLNDLISVVASGKDGNGDNVDWFKVRATQALLRAVKDAAKPSQKGSNWTWAVDTGTVTSGVVPKGVVRLSNDEFSNVYDDESDEDDAEEYSVFIYGSGKKTSGSAIEFIKQLRINSALGLHEAAQAVGEISKKGGRYEMDSFEDFEDALDLYWELYKAGFNVNVYRGDGLIYGAMFNGDSWLEMTAEEKEIAIEKRREYQPYTNLYNKNDDGDDLLASPMPRK